MPVIYKARFLEMESHSPVNSQEGCKKPVKPLAGSKVHSQLLPAVFVFVDELLKRIFRDKAFIYIPNLTNVHGAQGGQTDSVATRALTETVDTSLRQRLQ